MSTAVIIMVAVMAFTSIGMMFIAIIEFVMYMRQSRKDSQPVYTTLPATQAESLQNSQPTPAPAPVEMAEPAALEHTPKKADEAAADKADENSITFELGETHRQTLKEAYAGLQQTDKAFYDQILAAASELEKARVIESTYAVTMMQGRDNIGRLRVLRGIVTLDCTVFNPELAKYNKENGKKIKSRPTRFRIKSEDELSAAIYTLKVANQTSLENRTVKKAVKGINSHD